MAIKQKILEYLMKPKTYLTTLDALKMFHTTELRKYIAELRSEGWPIKSEWMYADDSDKRWKEYFIPRCI